MRQQQDKDKTTTTVIANAQERDMLKDLPDAHPIWDHASNALANLCVTLILLLSVEQIVLGGGIMNRTILYERIRSQTQNILNGYLDVSQVTTENGLKDYISCSCWGEKGGLVGALSLALDAYEEKEEKKKKEKHVAFSKDCDMEKEESYKRDIEMKMTIAKSIIAFSAIGLIYVLRRSH
eukprot:10148504-Ditylum_brightwellii.AAC.1